MRRVRILYGPPGTGKTTSALDVVDKALAAGIRPERIAYVSFTRKAANEAADRAIERFGLSSDAFPHFRTLHSMAYRLLGMAPGHVMTSPAWKLFSEKMGYEMIGDYDEETERVERRHETFGDRALAVYSVARAKKVNPLEELRSGDWSDVPEWALVEFCDSLKKFKKDNDLRDFADLLDDCREKLDLDLFVVDEGQDLTTQQWDFARSVSSRCQDVLLAGDDDQAIYEWAGADGKQLNRFQGERFVLPKSHRLPRSVFTLATEIVGRVSSRFAKDWTPREDEGRVSQVSRIDHVDVSAGEWLLMARTTAKVDSIEMNVRQQGFLYTRDGRSSADHPAIRAVTTYERLRAGRECGLQEVRSMLSYVEATERPTSPERLFYEDVKWPWEGKPDWMTALTRMSIRDREYVRAVLRRGEKLSSKPRLRLSTIHGAKGGEADNVMLVGGSTRRIRQSYHRNPDPEHRVWYVGVTRARQNLILVGEPAP